MIFFILVFLSMLAGAIFGVDIAVEVRRMIGQHDRITRLEAQRIEDIQVNIKQRFLYEQLWNRIDSVCQYIERWEATRTERLRVSKMKRKQ